MAPAVDHPKILRFSASWFDPAFTFESGQVFRWRPVRTPKGTHWEGMIENRWASVKADGQGFTAYCYELSEEQLAAYLRLSDDWEWLKALLRRLLPSKSILEEFCGLRLLKQDPWECLASFLIATNRNIPLIRRSIERLCQRYGEKVESNSDREWWTFPSPDRIASATESELRLCGLGYRAAYLLQTAMVVCSEVKNWVEIRSLPIGEKRRWLLSLPGVGSKVAECVLLFGFGETSAFPVDIWVERALRYWYPETLALNVSDLRLWAVDRFGEIAGYVQQFLYEWARRSLKPRGEI